MTETITIIGATGSPYTRKVIALMRCRRIPHQVIWGDPQSVLAERGLPPTKVALLPTLLIPSETGTTEVAIDSTPIIRSLERHYPARSVIPSDPALAFLNYVLEDFADEWCTKYMFHYRWHFAEDADNASTLLPLAMNICHAPEQLQFLKKAFSERQISRLGVVGSSAETAPVIEASYKRLIQQLEMLFEETPYLLGHRPASADFALFGQLSQLIGVEPTSRMIAHELSPRTVAWLGLMEDLSGIEMTEDHWTDVSSLSAGLKALLGEVGKMYVPALLANAAALQAGEKQWLTEIGGKPWRQQSFPYQGKCLMWIREEFEKLSGLQKDILEPTFAKSGLDTLLQ